MSRLAACVPNPARGEAPLSIGNEILLIRPSFAALVAAEEETGPLLALVDRAAEGRLALTHIEALLWHCLAHKPAGLERADFADALLTGGLAAAMPALRMVLRQVVAGGE